MACDLTLKVEHVLTFLTIIVGLLVVYVARNQFVLARERFKLDLFEKRFAIYKGVQSFLTDIMQEGKVSIERLFQYRAETQDAVFLLEDNITNYLKKIDKKANDLWATTEKRKNNLKADERSLLAEEESELLKWLMDQLFQLKNRFSPVLKFKTWK